MLLFVVCCLLFVVCCLLFVVCCLLFVVCCLLFVVCCCCFVVVVFFCFVLLFCFLFKKEDRKDNPSSAKKKGLKKKFPCQIFFFSLFPCKKIRRRALEKEQNKPRHFSTTTTTTTTTTNNNKTMFQLITALIAVTFVAPSPLSLFLVGSFFKGGVGFYLSLGFFRLIFGF